MSVELGPLRAWRHPLGGCLFAALGALLSHRGLEPLEVLGAAWHFRYRLGDVRREEFYYPCGEESLAEAIAPHHPVRSRWHVPPDPVAAWIDVRERLRAGVPVAVVVDNFHVPFRPAFGDVHSCHLVVVTGFDEGAGTATVVDAVPPGFQGPLPLAQLALARGSDNRPQHARDMFFAGDPIGGRWLELEVTGTAPALSAELVRRVLADNCRRFRSAPGDGPDLAGLGGLARFCEWAVAAMAAGRPVVDEVFVVAGVAMADTALHADYLAHAAVRLGAVRLREAARRVERLAHHWAAVRIAVATARGAEPSATPRLAERFERLLVDQRAAIGELEALADRP